MKPRLFIGCSAESLSIAYALQENLERNAEVTVWDQAVFSPSEYVLNELSNRLEQTDFGVFVLSPEDIVRIRQEEYLAARDNVIFELGLFIGRLGRERTFMVLPRDERDMRIPTDLIGLTPLTFDAERADGNLNAALGPASNKIARQLRGAGLSTRPRFQPASSEPAAGAAPDLQIDVPEQISLIHYLGNPHALIFVTLVNSGEAGTAVTDLVCAIEHDSGRRWLLPARTHFSPPPPGVTAPELPFTRLYLKPWESWSNTVRFFAPWSDAEQERVNELTGRVTQDIATKRAGLRQEDPPVQIDPELLRAALHLFERQFKLEEGVYRMHLAALSGRQVLSVAGYDLSLSTSALVGLRQATEAGFPFGWGIAFPMADPRSFLTPRLRPMDDADAVRAAYDRLAGDPEGSAARS